MSKKTDDFKQKPITDGMTAEQKREYDAAVHEAQLGNTRNFWDVIPVSGFSGKIDSKPMSDDLVYASDRANDEIKTREDEEILNAKQNKSKLIEKWIKSVEKLTAQIQKIQSDKTISVADKQRKIANRQKIIEDYKLEIEHALEYMDKQKSMTKAMYDKYMKVK